MLILQNLQGLDIFGWGCYEAPGGIQCGLIFLREATVGEREGKKYSVPAGKGFTRGVFLEELEDREDG